MIDTSARAFADFLQKQLKQPVVIVNKTGGGQAVGGKACCYRKTRWLYTGILHIFRCKSGSLRSLERTFVFE